MFFEGKRVLVTGGTGFIGRHLASKLAEQKAFICVIDRNIKEKTYSGSIKYHKADISDKDSFYKIIHEFSPEYIFHLAANNSHEETPEIAEDIKKTNILGTRNLLEASKDLPCKRFVFLSSGETYFGNKVPFNENMDVDGPTSYSKSKIESEKDCRLYIEKFGKRIVIIRASVVYGPGQKANMFVPSMINAAIEKKSFDMTLGEQTRDFIFVLDLVDAILKACMEDKASGQIINIGTGIPTKLVDAVEIVQSLIPGFKANIGSRAYRKNEIFDYYFDISKAKSILKWSPRYSLQEGVMETIKWHKNQM